MVMDAAVRGRPRVVVAVTPRLFGAALARSLPGDRLDVQTLTEEVDEDLRSEHIDCIVVTGSLPDGLVGERVIRLPAESGQAGLGSLLDAAGEHVVGFPDLAAVIELVERVCDVDER